MSGRKKIIVEAGTSGTSNTSGEPNSVWGDYKEPKMEKSTKRIVTLQSIGKNKALALKQAKHWFKMNPNRWRVNLKLSSTETILVYRKDVIKSI